MTPTFAVALAGQTRGLDERGGNGRRGSRGAILEDPLAANPVERAALSVEMRAYLPKLMIGVRMLPKNPSARHSRRYFCRIIVFKFNQIREV